MDQLSGLQVEKFSGTLEELGLDRRAYHILKRAGIHYVSNIITRGESRILNLKGMGGVTASHVFSSVAHYLDIPEEELFSSKVTQTAFSYEEKPLDSLETPVTVLDLPLSTLRTLNSIGVFTIGDLLGLVTKLGGSYDIDEFNKTEIRRIHTELNRYLSQDNRAKPKMVKDKPNVIHSSFDLGKILTVVLKDERTLQIVELRANRLLTLEEIAHKAGGVTRERIRQILEQVHERIRKNINLINNFCDYFEELAESLSTRIGSEKFSISALAEQYNSQLPSPRLSATEKELETLITIIRLLLLQDKLWSENLLQKRWKKTCFLACSADPPIKKHADVGRNFIKEQKTNKVSYKELALLILTNEKRPMHWSKIAERAYLMRRRDSFNATALYNALMSYPKLFVRVGAGTYALADWGLTQVDTYPDIIASIMKSSKKPLPFETIYHRVNQIRLVKRATLTMLLDLHPRFYKSLEKTYGLRVWLPSREKQTLRTPEWLVEEGDSYKRLEHASQRGYIVDNIIKADLE